MRGSTINPAQPEGNKKIRTLTALFGNMFFSLPDWPRAALCWRRTERAAASEANTRYVGCDVLFIYLSFFFGSDSLVVLLCGESYASLMQGADREVLTSFINSGQRLR